MRTWSIRNEQIIKNSDILIIYGASLGETDSYLWDKVAKRSIERGVPIIIYHYVGDAEIQFELKRLYKFLQIGLLIIAVLTRS